MSRLEVDLNVELLSDSEERAVRASAEEFIATLNSDSARRAAVWPATSGRWPKTAEVVLIPLERLGTEPGKSSARVLTGYFMDPKTKRLYPSKPMIVKLKRPRGREDDLMDEYARAAKVEPYIWRTPQFAIPIHCTAGDDSRETVLWSPYASTDLFLRPDAPEKLVLDNDPDAPKALLDLLRKPSQQQAAEVVAEVYELLAPLHIHAQSCRKRSLVREYGWYLRNVHKDDKRGRWKGEWEEAWGAPARKSVTDCGGEWPNPFWVLKRLEKLEAGLSIGAIHGDLHPRNVVLANYETRERVPHIIDFGWTRDGRAIAADFVLLEANLRFVALRPGVSDEQAGRMADWLGRTGPPKTGSAWCDERLELIQGLREKAAKCFSACKSSTDWDIEYVVPLFLVSLGLLKHAASFDNQQAAKRTVLALAKHIKEHVL